MRSALILAAVVVIGTVAVGLSAGRQVVLLVDRLATRRAEALPARPFTYAPGMMEIGDYGLETTLLNGQPADLHAEVDAGGGLTLRAGGKAFPLGTRIGPPDVSGRPDIPVAPEPGDEVHFTVARSLLSWPTPFAVNFMTGHSPSWRRNLYYRLTWRKPSGLALDVVWRYEQWFYPVDGWGGGYMTQEGTTGLVDLRIVAAAAPVVR